MASHHDGARSAGSFVEFATFYVAVGSETVHPNQTLAHREYLSAIDMMYRSARYYCRGLTATVLTDMQTELKGLSLPVKRVAQPINPKQLMLERAVAQRNYVLNRDFAAPIVLLDSDILINNSLAPVFQGTFVVDVTGLPDRQWP
jgi:hypothetical protein